MTPYSARDSIPKGCDKDLTNPSNYRGISLLSNISKLIEKLLLCKLQATNLHLNPLQGGFRSGFSSLHSAFIFQEAVQAIRDRGKKAYVAFLDVRKAFDTVWHQGLFLKMHRKGIPPRIWHLLQTWYNSASNSVKLNEDISRPFASQQGVHQGAILSPLLCSIFVDELLDLLEGSGFGAVVGIVYCGAPMFADDLALVASSPEELQSMLDIVSKYPSRWRYQLNAIKSVVLVFGEAPHTRSKARLGRHWLLAGQPIREVGGGGGGGGRTKSMCTW